MKKCPECKSFINDDLKVCNMCGYPEMEKENTILTKVCPDCQCVVEESADVCDKCGYPFEEERLKKELADKVAAAEEEARLAEAKAREIEKKIQEAQQKKLLAEKKRQNELKRKLLQEAAEKKIADAKAIAQQAEQRAIEAAQCLQKEEDEENEQREVVDEPERLTHKYDENEVAPVSDVGEGSIDHNCVNASTNDYDIATIDKYNGEEVFKEQLIKGSHIWKLVSKYKIVLGVCTLAVIALIGLAIRGKQPDSIKVSKSSLSVDQDSKSTLSYVIKPEDARNKKVTWKSSDEKIAVVDDKGCVTGVSVGNCTITVTTSNKKESTCKITVSPLVESIQLEHTAATLTKGSMGKIGYVIEPSDAGNKDVTWKSSDSTVCTVDDAGNLVGLKEGTCTITISTANGKEADCELTIIPDGPNFKALYDQYCKSTFATLARDESFLSIDTNPKDIEDYTDEDALAAILAVNLSLDLPDSVIVKMSSTRAIDGIQSAEYDGVEVSWSYHPNNGLEVIYEVK